MKKIKRKINILFKKNNKSGVALLFAILISTIILSIALGIISISIKGVQFNTSDKGTIDAFFAADTGIECALYNDKASGTTPFSESDGSAVNADCLLNGSHVIDTSVLNTWSFTVPSLGMNGDSCAKITVTKVFDPDHPLVVDSTKIVSKGYSTGDSNCNLIGISRIERVLEVNY